jgi:serine/threonine protein kinase
MLSQANNLTLQFRLQGKSSFFKKYKIADENALIGDGTFSLCMKCTSIKTKETFAVKIMKLNHNASQEIDVLEKCQGHSNIVKLIEKMSDNHYNYIVFELLSGGELFSRIRGKNYLSEKEARYYFQQILDAVSFMHAKQIVHKDLKPENILFVDDADDSDLKIVDFGFALDLNEISTEEVNTCFTLDYAAPESLVKGQTKKSRDLWSLGVILYTMLCGNTPFKPISEQEEQQEQQQQQADLRIAVTENIRKGKYNTINCRWSVISHEAKDLIEKLLRVKESERISLNHVRDHPWLQTTPAPLDYSIDDGIDVISKYAGKQLKISNDSDVTIIHENNDDDDDDDEDNNSRSSNKMMETLLESENREETRSNDDSSSGIVMSDRNEGSSSISSHQDHLDVQEEPENLSLKDYGVGIEERIDAKMQVNESSTPPSSMSLESEQKCDEGVEVPETESVNVYNVQKVPLKKTRDRKARKNVKRKFAKKKSNQKSGLKIIESEDLKNEEDSSKLLLNYHGDDKEDEFSGFELELMPDHKFPSDLCLVLFNHLLHADHKKLLAISKRNIKKMKTCRETSKVAKRTTRTQRDKSLSSVKVQVDDTRETRRSQRLKNLNERSITNCPPPIDIKKNIMPVVAAIIEKKPIEEKPSARRGRLPKQTKPIPAAESKTVTKRGRKRKCDVKMSEENNVSKKVKAFVPPPHKNKVVVKDEAQRTRSRINVQIVNQIKVHESVSSTFVRNLLRPNVSVVDLTKYVDNAKRSSMIQIRTATCMTMKHEPAEKSIINYKTNITL